MLTGTMEDEAACQALYRLLESDPDRAIVYVEDGELPAIGFAIHPDGTLHMGRDLYRLVRTESDKDGPETILFMCGAGAN